MITKKEAVKLLNSLHYKILHTSFCNKVREAEIEALVMAKKLLEQPKTDWIPCEERLLPKINEKVLVTIWCHRVEKGFLSHTGKWFVITEDGIDEATVIAWQPLPAPYKREGEIGD